MSGIIPKRLADAMKVLARYSRGAIEHTYATRFCPCPDSPDTLDVHGCTICKSIDVVETHLRASSAEARSN